jgi:hypothetical protein
MMESGGVEEKCVIGGGGREDERARERDTLEVGIWALGFLGSKAWVFGAVRCVKVGVLSRVTVRKHVEVLGPPHSLLPWTYFLVVWAFFWGGAEGEEGKREEGRVKDCLNKVHMCYSIKCFCFSFFVDHVNVLA